MLARQAGVVTLGQAVAAGVSASSVHRRVRSRAWDLLHPGVYLVGGHRYTDEVRIRAAWLRAGGAPAMVSGPAAAYWYRMLDQAPAVVELTVPRRRHLRPAPGMSVVRRDLSPVDLVIDRDLHLTAQPLTALETALALPDGSVFLDRALQRHVRFPTLYRAYCRNLGRRGSGAAARMISAAADRADSAAERLLITLLRDAGITGWVLGHPFGPWRIDLAFPAARLAVEVDGWAWHVDVTRFRNDRRKGNALHRGGWDLLRYTWHDLDGSPADCVREIVDSLPAAA
ncbi:type IV toxin-antitoxin system AbiEi family antitoxin domain-containing protein [Pseudonocardia sp. KRD-169]|uniref:Type IV toxin-antitoxin system AbiEi family antitoxin domain-containing protein n=1 Tax=Pseudonocardia abyssalis TaxID=2792008 RepID=A0ABS6ULW0_9PSEU|nr:type IV toxin-antitoxin system AbiEi family antitoxin domain-containing protein [Pseudonocardia abyssalis]MBW0132794.1 type IV toxin-antitoxin system AbiEi family antitoxin domain-containing protein [Pseudonocardia abyssalis]